MIEISYTILCVAQFEFTDVHNIYYTDIINVNIKNRVPSCYNYDNYIRDVARGVLGNGRKISFFPFVFVYASIFFKLEQSL